MQPISFGCTRYIAGGFSIPSFVVPRRQTDADPDSHFAIPPYLALLFAEAIAGPSCGGIFMS